MTSERYTVTVNNCPVSMHVAISCVKTPGNNAAGNGWNELEVSLSCIHSPDPGACLVSSFENQETARVAAT